MANNPVPHWQLRSAFSRFFAGNDAELKRAILAQITEEVEATIKAVLLETTVTSQKTLDTIMEEIDIHPTTDTINILVRPYGLADAMEHGVNRWNIGEAMLRQGGKPDKKNGGVYRDVLLANNARPRMSPAQASQMLQREQFQRRGQQQQYEKIMGVQRRGHANIDTEALGRQIGGDVREKVLQQMGRSQLSRAKSTTRDVSIRRISTRSLRENPGSWWHPGYEGLHFLDRIQQEFNRRLDHLFEQEF